jgi:hypothetical protein
VKFRQSQVEAQRTRRARSCGGSKFPRVKERGKIFDFLMRRRQDFTEQSGRHSFIVQSRGEIPAAITVSFS